LEDEKQILTELISPNNPSPDCFELAAPYLQLVYNSKLVKLNICNTSL